MVVRIYLISLLLLTLLFGAPTLVSAHRSGCHRWHSCPSDSGSYVCGDLGYPCIYPTYSEDDTTYYVPQTPPPPQTWTYKGKTYYSFDSANSAFWDDFYTALDQVYLPLLERKPTEEDRRMWDHLGSIYTGYNLQPAVDYIKNSQEYKDHWALKNASGIVKAADTSNTSESTDVGWPFLIGLGIVGYIAYRIYKAVKKPKNDSV